MDKWKIVLLKDRICDLYWQNGGDEFHYLFVCRYKSVCTSGKNTGAITKYS